MSDALPEDLADASPTTVLVYRELATADRPLTYNALVERTGRGRRTVRRATNQLEELDFVEPCWVGTQRRAYRLVD